ncbi:hypothetical protein HPB49_013499 [Dermacentor silvarum]|uniref:Uncharacterized protein n=1 Tax=Dermacentor silvarum TaxID=543639 RepID=A0ACB8CRH0_DERSI|nr:hypothetical protein HPB49_013499 [Dermacentor silvarum]
MSEASALVDLKRRWYDGIVLKHSTTAMPPAGGCAGLSHVARPSIALATKTTWYRLARTLVHRRNSTDPFSLVCISALAGTQVHRTTRQSRPGWSGSTGSVRVVPQDEPVHAQASLAALAQPFSFRRPRAPMHVRHELAHCLLLRGFRWLLPMKKQAPRLPLQDIPFQRHVVNKPAYIKKQRRYDPCPYVRPSQDEISKLKANLSACCPSLQVLRYLCPEDKVAHSKVNPDRQVLNDEEDLWCEQAQTLISAHLQTLEPLVDVQRQNICRDTMGQAANKLCTLQGQVA